MHKLVITERLSNMGIYVCTDMLRYTKDKESGFDKRKSKD